MSLESHETDCVPTHIVQVDESLKPLPSLERQEKPSIYKVPNHVAKLKPEAYLPQVVSFGPYHHHDEHLLPMEEHKGLALSRFLTRSGKPLKPILESLRKKAPDLEESYDGLDPRWKEGGSEGPGRFLELMVTDGCFMLEIMRKAVDYAPNDPIFSTDRLAYMTPYIRRDMLMLENQLPMLVLEHLVAVERGSQERDIPKLIREFYSCSAPVGGTGTFLHVLDFFRECLLPHKEDQPAPKEDQPPPPPKEDQLESKADGHGIIRSATELNEAGIKFKKSHTHGLDICFGGGVLRLPFITVDDSTESTFLNIMTFEGLHIGAGTEITSYVTFMDNIINDRQDVALLHEQGIIQNAIGSNKAVAKLFNSLCKEVRLASTSSLDAEQNKIDRYCMERRNRWRAYFNRTYFGNPWTILSLFAAIFLFALTALQTVYAVLGYY